MQRLGVRTEVVERALNHVSGSYGGVAGILPTRPAARRDERGDAPLEPARTRADQGGLTISVSAAPLPCRIIRHGTIQNDSKCSD
jgi:hypothetical protein